jgi:thiol-disulfide isomerase/thioredoxin
MIEMHRLFIGMCVLALAVVAVSAQEKKAPTPDSIWGELVGKFRAAKTDAERQTLFAEYRKKFLDFAEKSNDKEAAVKALGFVLQIPDTAGKDSMHAKALGILKKDYAENKDVSKVARAHAVKALMKNSEQNLQKVKQIKGNPAARAFYEKQMGKDGVEKLLASVDSTEKDLKGYRELLNGDLKGIFPDLSVGAQAPEVVSQDLDGKKVKLSDLKGKVVVLDIWATWCGPCKSMIPHTQKLVEKLKDKPFVFVSVSADAQKETLVNFLKSNKMPWTHWWSGMAGMVKDWEVEAFPTIYVLDAKGVIREKIVGANNAAVEQAVEKLMKEVEDKTKGKTS